MKMTKYAMNCLNDENYKPHKLLDHLNEVCNVLNDSQLSKRIGVGAPILCKIRSKKQTISGSMMIRIYDLTGVDVDKQRELAGIQKSAMVRAQVYQSDEEEDEENV